jgi:hypothetical protein
MEPTKTRERGTDAGPVTDPAIDIEAVLATLYVYEVNGCDHRDCAVFTFDRLLRDCEEGGFPELIPAFQRGRELVRAKA